MKTETINHIVLGLLILIIVALAYLIFRSKQTQVDYAIMRKIQQEVLTEQLKKIPRDSLIIEKYFTIREVTKKQLSEFEQANLLEKDSLFLYYYGLWLIEETEKAYKLAIEGCDE